MAETFIGQPWRQPYTAQQLQDAAEHQVPIVGSNGNWWRWDIDTSDWVDTGVTVATSLMDSSVTWPKLAPEARKSNPNLLDNAYFIGGGSQQGGGQFPINQRGLTEYQGTSGNTYTIDRWYVEPGYKVELQSDGLVLTPKSTSWCLFSQFIENYKAYIGKTLTLSFLVDENTTDGSAVVWLYGGVSDAISITNIVGTGVFSTTLTVPDNILNLRAAIQGRNTPGSLKVRAAKLELGPHQTLSYESAGGGGS